MDLSLLTQNWTVSPARNCPQCRRVGGDDGGRSAWPQHEQQRRAFALIALVGIGLSLITTVIVWTQPDAVYLGGATADSFAFGVRLVVLVAAAFGVLLSQNYIDRISKNIGEYYALILLAAVGMMLMGSAIDLIVIFLALEIFSLAVYVLSGFWTTAQHRKRAWKLFPARRLPAASSSTVWR
ncbi:MAG: hypothetical protein R2856_02340 [Caldilineaceae bacterium]